MTILLCATAIFSLAFLAHLLIWKIRLPKNQIPALLIIFFLILFVSFIVIQFILSSITIVDYLHITLFFVSLTLAYVMTYVALEVDSPSLVMIMSIANAGNQGLKKDEFSLFITVK